MRFSLLFIIGLFFEISVLAHSELKLRNDAIHEQSTNQISWIDFESAIKANEETEKPFFIEFYTDWCGWCKRMDNSTFLDESVVKFLSENFHTVKMNPETTEDITYRGKVYEKKVYGNKKYNELAVNLLNGKMSFPSFVILSNKEVRLGTIVGYHKSSGLISKVKSIARIS
ncbi:MAG: DUF255 domain-containing protein [Flavobacteriales bacterium]|nr:DUF255 domain-containing protein [Flavobacteriales bacterium]